MTMEGVEEKKTSAAIQVIADPGRVGVGHRARCADASKSRVHSFGMQRGRGQLTTLFLFVENYDILSLCGARCGAAHEKSKKQGRRTRAECCCIYSDGN